MTKVTKKYMYKITYDLGELMDDWVAGKFEIDSELWNEYLQKRMEFEAFEGKILSKIKDEKFADISWHYAEGKKVTLQKGKIIEVRE
jgi:hypothetical protein